MKLINNLLIAVIMLSIIACANPKTKAVGEEATDEVNSASKESTATIVTEDNFPQAFTNMRLGAMVQKTGG